MFRNSIEKSTSVSSSTSKIVASEARITQELLLKNLSILNVWLFDWFRYYGVIGPYFFENEAGATVAVSELRHWQMINGFFMAGIG